MSSASSKFAVGAVITRNSKTGVVILSFKVLRKIITTKTYKKSMIESEIGYILKTLTTKRKFAASKKYIDDNYHQVSLNDGK